MKGEKLIPASSSAYRDPWQSGALYFLHSTYLSLRALNKA